MGRVGDNEPQVHETIDDSFPENDPPSRTPPPPVTQARSHLPSNKEEEENLYYIPSQNHHQDQTTATSFPPQNSEFELPHQQAPAFRTTNTHFNQHVPQPGVHMGQPMMGPPVQPLNVNVGSAQEKAWNSGLFDFMNDPQNALITAFVPCVTFGQIAEIVDYGNTTCAMSGMLYGVIAFCIATPCLLSCSYRTKMRARFGLIESPGQDWIVHCFCEWCALCQEYRELKHMGYDPTIGWLGNQARMRQQQNQQFGMTPPIGQTMMM